MILNSPYISGSLTVTGNSTFTGTMTAQTLVVQTITSSVNFVTGSTKFGAISSNTHQFTGSVNVTGSLSVVTTGTEFQVTNTGVRIGNVSTDVHPITGSVNVSGSATFSGSLLANGIMSLGDDGTYGSTYKTLGLTGNANGSHRILAGTADDLYIASSTSRGITFLTNGTNTARMTILSSGNVLIGASSSQLDRNANVIGDKGFSVQYGGSTGTYFDIIPEAANGAVILAADARSGNYPPMIFKTSATERMRITSGGNVLINQTSGGTNVSLKIRGVNQTSANYSFLIDNAVTDLFYVRNDGIILTGAAANSPYNYGMGGTLRAIYSTSDGILGYNASIRESKKNIESLTDISWIYNLNPVKFNKRKKDEEGNYTDEVYENQDYGLIADEVEAVNADFVFYDHKEDGTKKLAGVEYEKLTPVLVKAIQELKAEIDALKAQ